MKIGILGSGSLGIIIGSLITARTKDDVDLIDTNKANVDALNEHGAKITGYLNKTVAVTAKHPDDLSGKYDLILLLTKQTYTLDALNKMLPFLKKDSIVCTLQNGVPEEYVSSIVGSERTMGAAVAFGATWKGPGVSELTTHLKSVQDHAFTIGELNGRMTKRIQVVQDILSSIGKCEVSTNIIGIKWTKLLMNATFSGMSAALGATFGDVLKDSKAMAALANVADETIKVAHANDISLEKMMGKNFEDLELKEGQTYRDKLAFYHEVWTPHSDLKASMLQDLEKGIKTEIDFINGFISRKGKELGIATPFNDLVCELIREAEATKVLPHFDINISRFEKLSV